MLGVITQNFDEMAKFYSDVLGFEVLTKMDNFVEFKNEGIRLAISTTEVMAGLTDHASYAEEKKGQSLELAFLVNTPEDVNKTYTELINKGAIAVKEPADLAWGQRAAFFADPDGNIHEVFANLK